MIHQTSAILAVNNVSKFFGKSRCVDDVSLEVRKGEFFSLLGGSGSGKTTLLRMIGGLETQCSGQIWIEGRNMQNVSARNRPTNMVFQRYAIFPHLSVRQNIEYGLANRELSRDQKKSRTNWALDMIKMQKLAERMPNELSGGQQQRVALARALVCEPKLVLLDEPLGALDKQLREEMQLELLQLQRTLGITFLLVTHDQEEALKLSDRIAVMSHGRILQVGSAADLYERPKSRSVAEFIGSMNFIDCEIVSSSTERATVVAGRLGTLSIKSGADTPTYGKAVLAVRPEKFVLGTSSGQNSIRGKIIARSYYGDRSHFFVEVDGLEKPLTIGRQNADSAGSVNYDVGTKVELSLPEDGAILLPREDLP